MNDCILTAESIVMGCNDSGINGDSFRKLLYYTLLTAILSDGLASDKEIQLINLLDSQLDLDVGILTASSAKDILGRYQEYLNIATNTFEISQKCSTNDELYRQYSHHTNGLRMDEILVKFICAGICVDGKINKKELDFVEGLVGLSDGVDENDTYLSEQDDFYSEILPVDEPPKVIKVGGAFYEDSYDNVFSVGAEIEIKGSDVSHLNIRVQLLDSSGFILDTFEETVYWVERGIFQFGNEYRIGDLVPSSFKVIVGARERVYLEDNYKPSLVFKCTGMRLSRDNNSYNSDYWLACMVENLKYYTDCPKTYVYVTFYDEMNNIVGGIQLTGSELYFNQPDRYDERIDCKSVISKIHTLKWSCDLCFTR